MKKNKCRCGCGTIIPFRNKNGLIFYKHGHSLKVKANRQNYFGDKNPFFGKHHSEKTKKRWSEIRKGKNMGVNNPMFGKHHSKETLIKISGENAVNWAGDNVGLSGVHKWVKQRL